jgi:PIN domain nuclease of toxin-antitoxin system
LIFDTTYLLPLAQIAVNADLLAAVARRETDVKLEDISVSLISVFELQAKSAKLNVPAKSTIRAIDAIMSAFRVVPFYEAGIIEIGQKLRKVVRDYVDCIVLATAVSTKEDLITEDSLILEKKTKLLREYSLRVLSFKDLVKT